MVEKAIKSAGICLFNEGHQFSIPNFARAIEARSFDGLFIPENTHMPIQRRQALEFDDERLRALAGFYDPFVTLSAAAAVTERIKLGTSVCLLTHRDTLTTAKAAASLDRLSNGRLILGVAGGLIAEAMENHGSPFKQRWRIVREKCLALRHVWQNDVASFNGEYVKFSDSYSYPKPLSPSGPPLWIGSNSAAVPGRVADYADGWIVFNGRYQGDAIADMKSACDDRNRNFDEITMSLMDAPHDPLELRKFMQQGFERFIFIVRGGDQKSLEQQLDKLSAMIAEFR
ncbi:MAG: TIGR03619 family F420-dependent LLM class oxidoreductase [Pseudomonadota bacterium]